jgi:hypothetical protein
MEIDGIILKGTFPKRRLKRFKQYKGYLFLDSKEKDKEEGKREVKRDLSSDNSRDELSNLVKEVEFIEGIKAKGEVLA